MNVFTLFILYIMNVQMLMSNEISFDADLFTYTQCLNDIFYLSKVKGNASFKILKLHKEED